MVAAVLSAVMEPLVNRMLVKSITFGQAWQDYDDTLPHSFGWDGKGGGRTASSCTSLQLSGGTCVGLSSAFTVELPLPQPSHLDCLKVHWCVLW